MRRVGLFLALTGLLAGAFWTFAFGYPDLAKKLAVKSQKGDSCFSLFNANAPGHDMTNAYLLSLASRLVYPDGVGTKNPSDSAEFQQKFRERFTRFGMKEFRCIEDGRTSTHLLVMSNAKVVVAAFRGTDPSSAKAFFVNAVETDADFAFTAQDRFGKGVKIHEGFWRSLDTVYPSLVKEITRQGGFASKKVFLTGHSLGGALATLCGLRLAKDGRGKATVYTFGCPRVGNEAFRKAYTIPLYRWVNGSDLVPMVPPSIVGYRHTGTLNNIKSNGSVKLNDREFEGIGNIANHASPKYCAGLFKNLPAKLKSRMPDPPSR